MASNFTIILFQRQHFGNQPGTFNDIEPNVPFVGQAKDFSFDCPNVDQGETAFLMFQSRDVDHQRNIFQINGIDVFGGLPASPSRDTWNGNILLLEPRHKLRETGNILHVESRNSSGGGGPNVDDFMIDNVVIEYKTRVVSFTEGTDITAQLNTMLAALTQDGGWGSRLLLPQGGPFYLSDTIHFPQVAGQELFGQGARATRFVWRGPGDRPAFDFNRCQDCGLGHFSLEVGERVGTDKSVTSLTCSGGTATVTATNHGFTVGQFVYIFGADQAPYNGRHVVTTVPDANTFTYEVRDCPAPTATGIIVALQAATLLTAVRFYNSEAPLTGPKVVRGQLSSKNFIERLFFKLDGQAQDGVQIVWDPTSTKELGKNDHHRLTNVQIQGYTDSGVVFQGDQMQDCVFDHCIIQGRDWGLYGINAARPTSDGVYRSVGFFFRDGTIMENQIADIYTCRNYGDTLVVDGVHSEGSRRFFDMPNYNQDESRIDTVSVCLKNVKHHAASPTIMINSVDAGADKLILASAHGYTTGKGPLRLTTTGTLPAGLATKTDYWAIVIDSDSIALASSLSNALAGTWINISDTGTGTHTVWAPEAAGEAIRYYANGPFTVENCAFGKLNEQANVYQIRVQPRHNGVRPRFTFDSIISQSDLSPVFTGIVPTRHSAGYRHQSLITDIPLIDNIDNGRQKPVTADDWLRVLRIVPRAWYRFGETAGPRNVDAVNTTDDELNIAEHHWNTGDGPVRLTTTGSLPGNLTANKDYWVIRVNTGSIALATTRSNALANVRVGITSAGAGTLTVRDGSDGKIYDCSTVLAPIDLIPNNAPRYRRSRVNFNEAWAEFISNTIDQQFYLNDITEINPKAHSVAFLIHHGAVTLTAGDEYLCTLGSGSTGQGGGPIVRFTAGGFMRATINGITQDGTYDYRKPGDYLTVAGYDYTGGGVFTVRTDKELIMVPTQSKNVGNHLRKGLGTGSTAGALKTAGFQVGLFAVFIDEAAEELIAMGASAHRRMGW